MTTRPKQTNKPAPDTLLRWLVFACCWVVVLWVRFDSTDVTLGKPELLFSFASLGVALYLYKQMRAGTIEWRRSPADLIIAGVLIVNLLSFLLSPFRLPGAQPVVLVTSYALCFILATRLFDDRRSIGQFLEMLNLLSLAVCLIAAIQYFGWFDIDFGLGDTRRVMSTLGNATYLSGFLVMMIPLQVVSVVAATNSRWRILRGGLIAISVLALFMTQARTGILVVGAVLLLVFTILRWGRPSRVILGALGLAVVSAILIFSVPGMKSRFGELGALDQNISLSRRMVFWQAGWNSVPDAPILGHGPGSYPFVVAQYRDADYCVSGSEDIVQHAHNELLELLVETGMAGLLFSALLFVVVIAGGYRAVSSGGGWQRIVAIGIWGSLIAILLDNMTGVSLRQAPIGMIASILAGILVSPLFQGVAGKSIQTPVPRAVRFVPLVIWVAVMIPFWQDASARLNADAELHAGRYQVSLGRHSEASIHFGNAVAAYPAHHVARFDLAVEELRTGDYTGSLETIDKIRSTLDAYPKINLLESLAWLRLDSLDRATQSIVKETRYRDHPEAYYTWSLILARMADSAGVRSALEKVLERNIAGMSQVHLDNSVRTLSELAATPEQRQRLRDLLAHVNRYAPENRVVSETLVLIEQRIRSESPL